MIHKNPLKSAKEPACCKPNPGPQLGEPYSKYLYHYASMQAISTLPREINTPPLHREQVVKVSFIPRHASEEEFKRFTSDACLAEPRTNRADEFQAQSREKKTKNSAGSKEDYKVSIGSKGSRGSKGSYGDELPRPVNPLKQTSSTTSAQTLTASKKQAPAFLKCKSKTAFNRKGNQSKLSCNDFKIIKRLGEGKFGRVLMVRENSTGLLMAMKIVEKRKIVEGGLLEQFIKQLKIQTYLKHANIIEVYGFFQDETYFYTLMQLGCDGQLYNILASKKNLTEEGASFVSKNLLQAVNYMHAEKILHRDIKPENIVMVMGNVKICDFGWAANKLTKQELRSTYCGTPLYLSPEILRGQRYDEKVDLWAIGVLAYELLVGRSPFQIYEQQDLYKIMTDDVSFPAASKVSKEFQEFIGHVLNKNPKQRLSSSELLKLKFIRKYEAFETCEQLCK